MADGSGRSSNSYHNSRRPTSRVSHSQSAQQQKKSVQWTSISSSSSASSASTRPTATEFVQSVQRTSLTSSTSTRRATVTELSGGSSLSISSIHQRSVRAVFHDSSKASLQRPSLSSHLSLSSSSTITSTTAVSQKYSISGPQHHEVSSRGSKSNPHCTRSQQNSERGRTHQHMTSISKNKGAGPQCHKIPSLQKAQGRRENEGATRTKKVAELKIGGHSLFRKDKHIDAAHGNK
ncbi:hypothetical protein TorRG33x02_354860 [Trema orientale]|uniref:Uncharacterized protein n=1 Tax=Trema orientale TaxID=63057 RepID=A0A2P5AAF6_TREOI|nr:hypothetical protein TorRG33x02_354860 [Trema orientale]